MKNSGATFVRAIQMILKPIKSIAGLYIDDMVVHSGNCHTYLRDIKRYLTTIRDSGVTLILGKCELGKNSVKYDGHIVGSGRHEPDPEHIQAVVEMQRPASKKQIRQVFGTFGFFRSYIPDFSTIAKPLIDLTWKNDPANVLWTEAHERAFNELKEQLCQAPCLSTPNMNKLWFLQCNASGVGVSACIGQYDSKGRERPVVYANQKLTPTQRAWSIIGREAYAAIWALKRFATWLFGAQITVISDHNPSTYVVECAPKSVKLTRWALALQEFDLVFKYRRGTQHVIPNCLPRMGVT